MNFKLRIVALLLLVMMLLSSCSLESVMQYIPGLGGETEESTTTTTTKWRPSHTTKPTTTTEKDPEPDEPAFSRDDSSLKKSDMLAKFTLTQEEIDAAMALLDAMLEGALPDPNGDQTTGKLTIDEVDAIYQEFETAFYHFAEQRTIASIIYYCDMSDEEASTRYLDTQDAFLDLNDKYNITCREIYLNSPYAGELFEGWSEEEIRSLLDYDPDIMALRKEIEELQVEVDNLDDGAKDYFDKSAALYVQIVTKNNQLAAMYKDAEGNPKYDNYYDYATENVYSRDYKAEDLAEFRQFVIEYVVPNFSNVYSDFNAHRTLKEWKKNQFLDFATGDFDAMSKNYLIMYLDSLEGTMGDSMRHVFENKNCIFSDIGTSHPTAFCTYLYETETPFCLFGSSGQTSTTIVHEIGHYYASLVNNDLSNYDLLETHSQGNEFLFLNYAKDYLNADVYDCIRAYQLVNACYVMIMATIIDEFEQAVYSLDSVEGYTSADFDAIMTEICEKYGGVEWISSKLADPYEYWRMVAISNPVYYISYAVSSVAAVEIFYEAEEVGQQEAYEKYTVLVEGVTYEDGFVNALKKAGLSSPFEEEVYEKIEVVLTK